MWSVTPVPQPRDDTARRTHREASYCQVRKVSNFHWVTVEPSVDEERTENPKSQAGEYASQHRMSEPRAKAGRGVGEEAEGNACGHEEDSGNANST